MKCPDCDFEMELVDMPVERWRFMIPFTQIEIVATDWRGKQWLCVECYTEKAQRGERAAYDAGAADGYEAALRESRRQS